MGKRVLLISTNRCTTPDPVFPLGLAHLAGALAAAGHECRWLDCQVDHEPPATTVAQFQPHLVGISVRNIDDVLIRKRETFYNSLRPLVDAIRQASNCPIVVGGSGFSIFPKELLEFSGADFGICGAGEKPLLALLQALDAHPVPEPASGLSAIPGLLVKRGGSVHHCAPPDNHEAHPIIGERPPGITDYYLRHGGMLNLQTQRGCACHCCYCTYPLIEGRAHRWHEPESVADEFEKLQRLGAKYVFIVDSVFNSSARHVTAICEAILRRGVKLSWGCFLRPQGLTPELMHLMARAGLAHIEFGSDSFSDDVLAAYQKGFTFDDIRHSSDLARQHHIDFCHFLIAGGPGETAETIAEGVRRSQSLPGAIIMAVVGMRIYPGTALFHRAVADGVIQPDANLLDPVYYVAPALTSDAIFRQLQELTANAPNWILGDPFPEYARFVERLRQRGVIGPLWSYLSMLQRFWPAIGRDGSPSRPLSVPSRSEPPLTPE